MQQPILVLTAGSDPMNSIAAEILRCEGYPWLEERPIEQFQDASPDMRVIVVAGMDVSDTMAKRLAKAVSNGVLLVVLTPSPSLAKAFGISVGAPILDAHLCVTDIPQWEHGELPLLCPDDTACPLQGGQGIADLVDQNNNKLGSGLVRIRRDRGGVWFYGYNLCQAILTLRHGTGRMDPPPDSPWCIYGPRANYSFTELSGKLPHKVPVADIHQDILRSILADALAGTALPRLWHFPDSAPAMWFIRGDGCGETGLEEEIETVEKHQAVMSFYRSMHSQFPGDQIRDWHERGHGMSIEADVMGIMQTTITDADGNETTRGIPAAEINATLFPAIRENLEQHRDSFQHETGLEQETVLFHGGMWSGLPMALLVRELGWHTALSFQSFEFGTWLGDRKGPYMVATALPMRYLDRDFGVVDLWYPPHQHIDMAWQGYLNQTLPAISREDPEQWRRMENQLGETYGRQLICSVTESAQRWHGAQMCTFHPVYVVHEPRPGIGTTKLPLEMSLDAARNVGCRFINVEDFSRFYRARIEVRLTNHWTKDDRTFLTLESPADIPGLTLLLPETVHEIWSEATGLQIPLQKVSLEGRQQRALVVDMKSDAPLNLCMK